MKRSETLQPLSREHYFALSLAKVCERTALSGDEKLVIETCLKVLQAYENQLEPHFQFEESSLLPLLRSIETQPLVQRTLADHYQLRALLNGIRQNDAESLRSFGKHLADHVRFEERELFPLLEDLLH
jgi:hemerythrin-like domain-containing protein